MTLEVDNNTTSVREESIGFYKRKIWTQEVTNHVYTNVDNIGQ